MNFSKEVDEVIHRLGYKLPDFDELRTLLHGMAELGYFKGRSSVMGGSVESVKPISAKEAGFHE